MAWNYYKTFYTELILIVKTKINSTLGQCVGEERRKERGRETNIENSSPSTLKLFTRQQLLNKFNYLCKCCCHRCCYWVSLFNSPTPKRKWSTPVLVTWIKLLTNKFLYKYIYFLFICGFLSWNAIRKHKLVTFTFYFCNHKSKFMMNILGFPHYLLGNLS